MQLVALRKRPLILIPVLIIGLVVAIAGSTLLFTSRSSGGTAQAPTLDEGMPAEEPAAAVAEYAEAETAADGMALQQQSRTNSEVSTAANASQPGQTGFQRLVIKNAELSLEVENVREAEASIRTRVDELGGYIVQVESSGTDEHLTSRVTFRVPAERFEEALSGVQGLAHEVRSRTVSGDDVTEEFVDLEARLTNLEATRDRLVALLEQANRVEDALQVNTALTDVQGQLEQIRGRMEYLQQSAALSTVNVYLMPIPVTPIVQEGSWHPLVVAQSALRNLVELGQGLVNVGIVLLVWTPVWLPLLLLGRWGWRRLRGRGGSTQGVVALSPDQG